MKKSFMDRVEKSKLLQGVIVTLILLSLGYDIYSFWSLRQRKLALENQVIELNNNISNFLSSISRERNENKNLTEALQTEQQINANFQIQIQDIAGTVGILDKLSKTDVELLK